MSAHAGETAVSTRCSAEYTLEPCLNHRRGASRRTTNATWSEAVERVIRFMHERVADEPPTLSEMAQIASFSPYHFHRVFCLVTGVPPRRFMSAVRLEVARRLLADSCLRVTDVCFEVGYQSLGTFSAQFTRAVGVAPKTLRRLSANIPRSSIRLVRDNTNLVDDHHQPLVTGHVHAPEPTGSLIFVGLFSSPLPQGRPHACTLLIEPGEFRFAAPADGTYYLFGAAVRWPVDRSPARSHEFMPHWIGACPRPVHVSDGRARGSTDLLLRPRLPTDPPIVVSLSSLLAEHLTGTVEWPRITPDKESPRT